MITPSLPRKSSTPSIFSPCRSRNVDSRISPSRPIASDAIETGSAPRLSAITTDLAFALPPIEQQISLCRDRHVVARHQLRQFPSQPDQRLVEAEDRSCVGLEIDHVFVGEIVRQRQPRRRRREAGIGRRIPLHRRPAAVAADADARHVLLEGIAHLIGRDRDLMHADLVAVIQRRRSAQRQQQHRGDARLVLPDPACHPRTIVIAQHPVRPRARRQRGFVVGDDLLDRRARSRAPTTARS